MKSIYLILLFIVFLSLHSQSESRFPIDSTSIWRVDHIRNGVSTEDKHEKGDDISKYFFNGDTVINSKLYFKLFKTGISWFDTPFYYENVYKGALRDNDNKFYFVGKNETQEVLLYNFNANVDDTIQVPYEGVFEEKIVSAVDTMYDGRRIIHFNPKIPIIGCGDQYFIEGIGGSGGLLEGPACNHFWTSDNHLVCYVQNNLLIYHDYNFQFNCDVVDNAPNYIDSTCVWRVDKQYENDLEADFEKLIYFFDGDTLIGDSRYLKLFKTGYQLLIQNNGEYFSGYNNSVYMGALKEKSNELFFIKKGETSERLLYNFNLNAGDIIGGDIYKSDTIKSVDTILDNRKVFYMSANFWEKNIMQGIGSEKGLLENEDENSLLTCFMKNNASVFHSGSGAECLLNYDDLNFWNGDKLEALPINPVVGDDINLVVRLFYNVLLNDPIIPVVTSCEKSLEDNSFSFTLSCKYDNQNKLPGPKMVVPIFDTIQIGNLHEGYYSVDISVNTTYHDSDKDYTIEGEKYLYSYFEVTDANAIINQPIIRNEIKVYTNSANHLLRVENLKSELPIHSISIYNLLGERLEVLYIPETTDQKSIFVEMGKYKKGFYLLRFNGNRLNLTEKIVLE